MTTACKDCLVPFTSGIYTGLSGLSTLFFMIGAIGYTATKDTISDIPWIYGTFDGFPDDKSYFSLRAEYDDFQTNGGVFKYATYADYYDWCEKCESDGHSAYVMCIIACLTSLVSTILCALLIKKADFSFAHFVAAAISGVACFIAGIALIVFMGVCQSKIKKFYSGDEANVVYPEFHWGAGSILVAAGMCFMFIVSVGMIISGKYGGAAAPALADRQNEPNTAI
mmetsp:Transcript_11205/g.19786  ORF Transcript_11205/g.19786 Transcript_11205/m.19786 type:complete len:225 (-) Transcript_11205:314-988(-)